VVVASWSVHTSAVTRLTYEPWYHPLHSMETLWCRHRWCYYVGVKEFYMACVLCVVYWLLQVIHV